jgi:hypothetical protein
MGANDDRGALEDLVQRVDGLDSLCLQLRDDALVMDDLAEGVRTSRTLPIVIEYPTAGDHDGSAPLTVPA